MRRQWVDWGGCGSVRSDAEAVRHGEWCGAATRGQERAWAVERRGEGSVRVFDACRVAQVGRDARRNRTAFGAGGSAG